MEGLDKDSKLKPRINRRDEAERFAGAVATHCKFVPKAILEHKLVNGVLLREQVRADMDGLGTGQRLGTKYLTKLIIDYTADSAPASSLKPTDDTEEVNDQLLDALAKMHDDNPAMRNNRVMIKYFQTADGFNQTEWIGVAKIMSDPTVERLRNHDECMMEWMKFAARTNAKEIHPSEIVACIPMFDKAMMMSHWSSLRKSAIKLSTFLELHLDTCALLMDRTDLMAVIASKSSTVELRNGANKNRVQ